MYSNGKNVAHSGQGHLTGNIVALVVFMVLFIGAIYSLSYWTLENAWLPGISCFVLLILSFGIPQHILGMSDRNPTKTAHQD
ncbi:MULTISPECIES: hypothetical protein [Paeniglutamicibacter]|uniref:Uncharacterized protein n=1 Tax=Paeniglutamicibacter terrestris TaxID=2723403 RepID=A0ABX1G7T9_9MICC|nr:hypothetical protein [Paeniglutamicibacter sp. Y32M11]ASN40184.1 hypothetical protein CGQ24_15030 [Arthrobacter sp. 7749]NKG21482.1 hypothetical protein [Paeniglutamicibacter terrestris]QXQ11119.1 hypothetical protein KUF55_04135 [Paeniglutamicibacter sp. Y32M11]